MPRCYTECGAEKEKLFDWKVHCREFTRVGSRRRTSRSRKLRRIEQNNALIKSFHINMGTADLIRARHLRPFFTIVTWL